MTPQKKSPRRRPAVSRSSRSRRAPVEERRATPVAVEIAAPPADVPGPPPEIAAVTPEPALARRMPPPEPERALPARRRAIFFDVENTSRAEHIGRVIDHLAVDRAGHRTDFFAVGNWRVIGADTARLLARHGAQLVHSAPSAGVRDWSDLRIAVAAGLWLAAARPGDVVEIVSADRAFDAVGDVAASLGITYRRLSLRDLAGHAPPEPAREEDAEEARHRRGRRGRRGHGRQAPAPAPAHHPPAQRSPAHHPPVHPPRGADNGRQPAGEPHTAPHDEIVAVVHDLIQVSPSRGVSLDTLANALKSRGFSRPPGSPRLITRLRRIKEITVSRAGMITLVDGEPGDGGTAAEPAVRPGDVIPGAAEASELEDEGPQPGNEALPAPEEPVATAGAGGRRRRSHRGGRRRRGRRGGGGQPA